VRSTVAAWLAMAGLFLLTTPGYVSGQSQTRPSDSFAASRGVLEVPYLPQSELLCGGAALAMVERWWGRRGVQAEEFAALVEPARGGISTGDLASAARSRGWDTRAISATVELSRQLLRQGVPVIALIEVGPDRYHYVVVLGWDNAGVVFHDPAGNPFTRLTEADFVSRWAGAGYWALIVRPSPQSPAAAIADVADTPSGPGTEGALPCSPWLDRAVDAAVANELEAAADLLSQADRTCPAEPLIRRELAGVRFKQGRYAEAGVLAGEYVMRAPRDPLGWQLLGTSRYLGGDADGALEAWNAIGRPVVDLLVVTGSHTVRFQRLATAVAVPPGTTLTRARLALAQRRLADMPTLRQAHVTYRPVEGGRVELQAAVQERPTMDPLWRLAAAGVIGGVAQETVRLELAIPNGDGELWSAEWRWAAAHPRAAVRFDKPTRLGVPGVLGIEGGWERVRVARGTGGESVVEDEWRSAGIGFGGWLTTGVRPSAKLGIERWSGERNYLTLAAGASFRALGDRLRSTVTVVQATALSEHRSYLRGSVQSTWASSLGLGGVVWSARVGGDWTSKDAPVGALPYVGGNLGGAIPLRAEPSPQRDWLAARTTGHVILHAGSGADVSVYRWGPVVFAAGVFLDGARVVASPDDSVDDRLYLDGGVGMRVGLAEAETSVVRIDVARGLLDGRGTTLTVGVHRQWPFWNDR
jgi:hypothetical protein